MTKPARSESEPLTPAPRFGRLGPWAFAAKARRPQARVPQICATAFLIGLGALTVCAMAAPSFARSGQDSSAPLNPPTQAQEPASPSGNNPADQETETPDETLATIQTAVDAASVPEVKALSEALGVGIKHKGEQSSAAEVSSLEELGDLDGDGVPEVGLKWLSPEASGQDSSDATGRPMSWRLFLLAWDGQKWRVSDMGGPTERVQFEVIRLGNPSRRGIAVVVTEGDEAVPYPAVYEVKDHEAVLAWDGKADDSRYESYPHGRIEFADAAATAPTEMTASGHADPGLLVFPKEGARGFEAKSTYRWDGQGYVPVKTEYAPTPDYTLYRFISALHLHDFRGAYALIDPSKFLNTDSPALDKFKELVETAWPEFLEDNVFEAPNAGLGSPNPYAFVLGQGDKKYVYKPSFNAATKPLLTGLERQEEQ